ncbi:MerR family transcriptional regulator [Streptomyces paromomycinus]|uniref:MerR family transcriptional regulator n=1 Tax=Streptomyces paromomycinus TaxID=92743 RepID=A0A401VZ79_STREY|nr:MerR family transcriptional regulator [Streptomyces paromomycinus]GCD42345.1 MerR family transcriptional regulator [Streptomyces paromomycinus]
MAWPTAEVARMSGVTARTLRHYDDIGLLTPAWTGANGHRYYEERQLLRLQQILVLRELALGLPEIGRILAAQVDELAALRGHHRRLLTERERTAQMIRLADLLAAGLPADADAVQAEIDTQYRTLARIRPATAEEYRAIGRTCVENEHWHAAYETIAPGLATYQRAAIDAYTATRLH